MGTPLKRQAVFLRFALPSELSNCNRQKNQRQQKQSSSLLQAIAPPYTPQSASTSRSSRAGGYDGHDLSLCPDALRIRLPCLRSAATGPGARARASMDEPLSLDPFLAFFLNHSEGSTGFRSASSSHYRSPAVLGSTKSDERDLHHQCGRDSRNVVAITDMMSRNRWQEQRWRQLPLRLRLHQSYQVRLRHQLSAPCCNLYRGDRSLTAALPSSSSSSSSGRTYWIRQFSTAQRQQQPASSKLLRGLQSLYALDGGEVQVYNAWGRFKWHAKLTFRVLLIVGTALACVTALVWGSTQMYVEYLYPTPSVFSDRTRIGIRYLYLYAELLDNKILANENAKDIPILIEKEIESKGGWENAPAPLKNATVGVLVRLAELRTSLGLDQQAAEIYESLIKHDALIGPKLADALTKLGAAYSRCNKPSGAFDAYIKATQVAWESLFAYPAPFSHSSIAPSADLSIPKLDYTKPVLPPPSKDIPTPSKELLDAVMAVATEYCKVQPPQPAVAFPIFLSLLRATENMPDSERDICREATIQTYLGEVMWSLGKTKDGYGWTLKALDGAEKGLAAKRGRRCLECAEYAVANAILMRKTLCGVESALEKDIAEFRKRERLLSRYHL